MKKIALITGATSGIGKAIAFRLAKENINLIITGRRANRLEELRKEIESLYKIQVLPLCFDIQSYEEVQKSLNKLDNNWKNIDILINNAGLAVGLNPIHKGIIDDWERMIDTNIKGLLYVSRVITPLMVERKRGHIINIGSVAGKEVYPNGNVYCATKHAVMAISKGMMLDLSPYNIRVTQISPGTTKTEISLVRFKNDKNRADKVYEGFEPLSAEDVAEAVYFVTKQPEHVDIQDLLIMPSAQADTSAFFQENKS